MSKRLPYTEIVLRLYRPAAEADDDLTDEQFDELEARLLRMQHELMRVAGSYFPRECGWRVRLRADPEDEEGGG